MLLIHNLQIQFKLCREWDDVYQKDSDRESEPEEEKASTTSSRRNSSDR